MRILLRPRRTGTRGMLVAAVLLASGVVAAVSARQQPQFRGGTDLVAIDFLAIDEKGQPVVNLKTSELAVKVDGRARDIKALQFVKLSSTSVESPTPAPKLPPPYGTNDTAAPGRSIIIVVDHEHIGAGDGKMAIDAASRFVDRLAAVDRVGVVTLPNGRVEVDLTTNHGRIRAALKTLVGAAPGRNAFWNISVDEAITIQHERIDSDKPITQEVIDRECSAAPTDSYCRTGVLQEALLIARQTEASTRASLIALRGFFDGLGSVEGPRSVLFLSGSLVRFESTHLDMDDVARAAARAQAQVYIIQPQQPMMRLGARNSAPTRTRDLGHELGGLEDLAGATGGELFRLSGLGDTVFTRIADQMSAHYLLGFEPRPSEQNGKPHALEITTMRRGVTIRARPSFVIDDPNRAPPPPLSPETWVQGFAPLRDLPLRATAYSARDADPRAVKVIVAVEPAEGSTALTAAAFALVDVKGQTVAQWREEGANVVRRPLVTGTAPVPPGEYRLRVAAVDTLGRRGAVDYEFAAGLTEAPPLKIGTLMLGRAEAGAFRPSLLAASSATLVTAYFELYGVVPENGQLGVTLELAVQPDGPALASSAATVLRSATEPDRHVATGDVPVDQIGAGDYVIRAEINLDGRPIGRVWRTFRRAAQ